MTSPPTFPIFYDWRELRRNLGWPPAVPWAFVEPLRPVLERRGGTLEVIADRIPGGLSPQDLYRAAAGDLAADELDPAVPTGWYVDWIRRAAGMA